MPQPPSHPRVNQRCPLTAALSYEPHGFEGFRLMHVELLADDQPVPDRIYERELPEGHVDARGATAHLQVEQLNYAITGIDQLVVEWSGFPSGKPLSPDLPDGVGSPVDTANVQHRNLGGIHFNLRVPEFSNLGEHAFPVGLARACAEGFRHSPHDLHVLV